MTKKSRKLRGSRTHGWGSEKKHRGAGSRGGRGFAGSMSHHRIWFLKNLPEHFIRKGFKKANHRTERTINLDMLSSIALTAGGKNEVIIDVKKFDKVLGKGRIDQPIVVQAAKFSATAKAKIEAAGGKVVLLSLSDNDVNHQQ